MVNVRPFREDPTLWNKIGVALVYLVLGWTVTSSAPGASGDLLSIFLILGILAWVFVVRRRSVKYFIRYHIVQALLLNISIAALLWLLLALLGLLETLPGINMLVGYIYAALFAPMSVAGVLSASVKEIVLMSITLVMAYYCLQGRYTELPWITDGVRHWI